MKIFTKRKSKLPLILNIDTSTTACSVAVSDAERILASEFLNQGYTHAENLHLFIRKALLTAGVAKQDLSAIAVSKGPGSYTGLRIGVSAAKGLAYALKIPLIGIDTLELMSAAALEIAPEDAVLCPLIDARRMEVYTSVYNRSLEQLKSVQALVMDEAAVLSYKKYTNTCWFGDGMPKCSAILEQLPGAVTLADIVPDARYLGPLAYERLKAGHAEDIAYFEPFYLKEFLVGQLKSGK